MQLSIALLLLWFILLNVPDFRQKDGEFLSGHEVFLRRVATAFNNFAESTEKACREK